MTITAYQPLENLEFSPQICFLSGEKLDENNSFLVPVFPNWLMERYELEKKLMLMMGGIRMMYRELVLPASTKVAHAIQELDLELQNAFEKGYEGAKEVEEIRVFQLMARIMYGMVYHDFVLALEEAERNKEEFKISDLMRQKLKNLHLMLQSLIRPVEFVNFKPWSMQLFPIKISKDILNYKDEPRKLNFCFGMHDFGFIACLQDNGEVEKYNAEILEKIEETPLHPIQFQELYARFMYSNYILRDFPDYQIVEKDHKLIFSLVEDPFKGLKKYAEWNNETYAKVLGGQWDPWGIPMHIIYDFPNDPISYIIDDNDYSFIHPSKIKLPY